MITKAEITAIKALADKRGRDQSGMFVAEGFKLVEELVNSNLHVQSLYTTTDTERLGKYKCEHVSPCEMGRISRLKTPSQWLAVASMPKYENTSMNRSCGHNLVLALDGVQDPGNMGTIIRIADWFGIDDIFCSADSADVFNPKVVQATMGAILRVRVHYCDLVAELSKVDKPVYGTFLEGENIYEHALSSAGVIVMGSEGQGVSPEVGALVNSKLFIPPYPSNVCRAESLNVATATAITCAEFRRRNVVG